MNWKGKDYNVLGDLTDIVVDIAQRESYSEAAEFTLAYERELLAIRSDPSAAKRNIAWVAGYCGMDLFYRILNVFNVDHPVFGRLFPTPMEAFVAGMREVERRGH